MITSLIHFYGCLDLQKTKEFYVDLCGLTLFKDQGKCHIYALSSTAMVGFCLHLDGTHQEKSPIITFVVEDVSMMHSKMVEAEKQPSEMRINEFFKLEHFFMKDPNGYTVEVQRFIENIKEGES